MAVILLYLSLSLTLTQSLSLRFIIIPRSDLFPISPHLSRSTSVVSDLQEEDGFVFKDVAFMVLDEGWYVSKVLGLFELGIWLSGASDVMASF